MGTFANLYRESGAEISKEKIEEFKKRLEVLYQAGGMMELERVSLFGKTIGTIRKAAMHEYGMDFWELWGCFSGVARRRISEEREEYNHIVGEITTMELFHQSPDNMIPYWEPGGSIKFSEEQQNWFQKITV